MADATNNDPKVTVYSASWCGFCHMAKEYLKSKNVAYKDIDVDKNPDAAKYIVSKTGQAGIPVLEIGDAVIVGFDRPRIDSALDQNNLIKV
jgi:glutaredoxin-like YruB-family protein